MLQAMLDTNLCIRVLRDRPAYVAERFVREGASLCLSTIVLHELQVGAYLSSRPEARSGVDAFAARLEVLDFDEEAADHAAEIRADLKSRGQMIGSNDILIAGHARSRGLKLITGNLAEFSRVDGLRCEDWLA